MNIIRKWVVSLVILSYLMGIITGLLVAEIIAKLLWE